MNVQDTARQTISDLKRAVAGVRVEPRMREVGRVLYDVAESETNLLAIYIGASVKF